MNNEFNGIGNMCGGGSGGAPADYEDLKNQVASNATNIGNIETSISEMQETIQSMSGGSDEYYYIPIYDTEALILKGANYIDTGLKLNGNTEITVIGSLPDTTKQAVFVGAYKSNSERTVLKILGKSQKIQSQWSGNVETTEEQVADMDFSRRIYYYQTPERTQFSCSNKQITLDNTGFDGTDDETPLLLFNQTKTGDFNNGALHGVRINLIRRIGRRNVTDSYGIHFRGARKYKKSDSSFVGYTFIQLWWQTMFVRELPLPDGAYFELYELRD